MSGSKYLISHANNGPRRRCGAQAGQNIKAEQAKHPK
jgi:hypothetical protein